MQTRRVVESLGFHTVYCQFYVLADTLKQLLDDVINIAAKSLHRCMEIILDSSADVACYQMSLKADYMHIC